MKPISLFITNPHGFDVRDQPVSIGIPLPKGGVRAVEELRLLDRYDRPLEHAARVLSRWPDGSARWLFVETSASVDAGRQVTLRIQLAERHPGPRSAKAPRVPAADRALDPDAPFRFDSEGVSFHLEPGAGQVLATARPAGSSDLAATRSRLELIDLDGARLELEVLEQHWTRHDSGYGAVLETSGEYRLEPGARAMRVTIEQTVLARSASARVEITLHNPDAALHPGGIWDLGDPGSLRFKACALVMRTSIDAAVEWRLNTGEPWQRIEADQFSIVQAGSGGEHWSSPVHVDEHGRPTPSFRGYRVIDGPDQVAAGDRCEPALTMGSGASKTTIRPERFWQRFPKALRARAGECRVELFPELEGVVHELQGGESSTSVLYLGFGEKSDILNRVDYPLHVSLDGAAVFRSRALPDWHDEPSDARYSALLETGLDGEWSFLRKRETIDEYGWRHFGELYADHETWNRSFDGIFVSHYNNQYDPLFGFARRYLQTGDPRWFELANDLARHVLDIDLYRTEADRPEYNQGLFWHTDHYVQAHTATHRTYSRDQRSDQHELSGGGPGGQHCYTSGLRLYHQLTGNARARQAVFDMTRWMGFVYEGTGSMLERARASLASDLPIFLRLLGKEKVLRYRYPLDRGVGNYIRALLDCFELDGERQHLDRVGSIIRETVGPADDIEDRDLGDVEHTWFYTVFLQAVVAFLDTKRENGELDADFHHARSSLLHYARWMLAHEMPYLDSPDKLEYPNDTWVAQDVRKAALLHAAYRYSLDDRQAFLARATYFKEYVLDSLESSDTLHYTRIQAILLQNHGPVGNEWAVRSPYAIGPIPAHDRGNDAHASFRSHAGRFTAAWRHCLRTFSPARETAWLRHRFPRFGRARSGS